MLRRLAAVCFAATLAWDYSARYDYVFGYFSTWSLLLQFIYFQLPNKSRALAFIHSIAFICSTTVPLHYLYALLWDPFIEVNRATDWEVSYSTVIIRSILVHFVPMFFHAVDITTNQALLITTYQWHPRRLMVLWSISSYFLYSFVYDFVNSDNSKIYETVALPARSEDSSVSEFTDSSLDGLVNSRLLNWGKLVEPFVFFVFGFFLLTMLILRPAYNTTKFRTMKSQQDCNPSQSQSSTISNRSSPNSPISNSLSSRNSTSSNILNSASLRRSTVDGNLTN